MRVFRLAIPIVVLLVVPLLRSAPAEQEIPDFTKGDELPEKAGSDWNLGPTGARGWFYAWRGSSEECRQILITEVAADSPASDVLEAGDVILGLGGKAFDSDARIAFAKGITKAEAGDGRLKLLRWREGRQSVVVVPLRVLGSYSPTAPWDCTKSDLIFRQGCEALATRMRHDIETEAKRKHPIQHMLNALALLASPERDRYMDVIRHEVEWARKWEVHGGYTGWDSGWVNLLLAEYLIATGDESVRPDLLRVSNLIATGASNVGTWGHRFAYEHNGILRGYGAMNQIGLSLTTSLAVAREAGVRSTEIDQVIEKSALFLRFYAGKGGIPYGDHYPWTQMHDDNGKASAGAVLFDVLGEPEAADFFSRLGLASYGQERETGHTGNFFNMIWALPGVARSGSHATGAWIEESAWLLDLARRHDFSFDYLGIPGHREPYRGWDCSGGYLLGLSLNHASLRFTGAEPSGVPALGPEAADAIIAEGRGYDPRGRGRSPLYDARTTDDLFGNLGSWSATVRERAAKALTDRPDERTVVVKRLVTLLEGGSPHERHGACATLEEIGPDGSPAVPALAAQLDSEDLWLRVQAAEALAKMGQAAAPTIPAQLELVAAPAHPDDPRGCTQRFVAMALFGSGSPLAKSIKEVDRELLRTAIVAVLQNEDGRARGALSSVYQQLSFEEIAPILPAVFEAVKEQAPSGVMFSDGIRHAGLKLLAKHRIAEGIPLCVPLIELDRWKGNNRLSNYLKVLESYGAEAQSEIPNLIALVEQIRNARDYGRNKKQAEERIAEIEKTIDSMRKATSKGPLRNLVLR